MITKIFYSLVLFPSISYDRILLTRYKISRIIEKENGCIEVVFQDIHTFQYQSVYFTHRDFFSTELPEYTIKNWIITSSSDDIGREVFTLLSQSDIHDFHFFQEKNKLKLIPFGVVLTITSKCNLFCNYCFNDYDYPLKDRNFRKWLWLQEYKNIIDKLYIAGTRDIIITGWEPFSANFLFDLLEYIRDKGIFIRINTNWTLLFDKTLERLNENFSVNLMVSMHEFNNDDYYTINKQGAYNIQWITGLETFKTKYDQKIFQLEKIVNFKNITLDFLTILTPKNIIHLSQIYAYVCNKFQLENWHFFRLYSTGTTKWISREMITLALAKLYKLNHQYGVNYKIVDSVPFCVMKNLEVAGSVIDGELSESHNVKTIITTDGNIQIMSAFDSNLWSIFDHDIGEVWSGEYVQKMLNNGFLPKECSDCLHKEKCRGWSRMDANIYNGGYDKLDPLAHISNKICNE